MNIQVDGTGMQNKGAELMLYSILDEIEKRFPSSTVIYNTGAGNINEIDTCLDIKHRFFLKYGKYPSAILRRLNLNLSIFESFYVDSNIDVVLDGSGFRWGDQWDYDDKYYKKLINYYKGLKKNGTKIILLPQAFGPFNTINGGKIISILNNYVDFIIAREKISYNYLIEAGIENEKTFICTDFSVAVKGEEILNLKTIDGLCIIPNIQMIKHSNISKDQYIRFIRRVIGRSQSLGIKPFLLNHEGKGDLSICKEVIRGMEYPLEIISGLNAKQTKGVISKSYAVISSRYHGVASALNQGVPCLATSWSHKYEELFKDFGLNDKIININDSENNIDLKLEFLLNSKFNRKVAKHLIDTKPVISDQVNKMWDNVFDIIGEDYLMSKIKA